jgi:EamA domain-containing membrane protein RarD
VRYYDINRNFFLFLSLSFAEFSFKIRAVIKLNTMKGMQLGVSLVYNFGFCYSNYIESQSIQVRQQRQTFLIFMCEGGSPVP